VAVSESECIYTIRFIAGSAKKGKEQKRMKQMRKQWHATEKINNFYIGPPPPHAPDLPELVQINNNYNWPVSYSNSILFGIGIAESV